MGRLSGSRRRAGRMKTYSIKSQILTAIDDTVIWRGEFDMTIKQVTDRLWGLTQHLVVAFPLIMAALSWWILWDLPETSKGGYWHYFSPDWVMSIMILVVGEIFLWRTKRLNDEN